jgi:cell division protein FtsB
MTRREIDAPEPPADRGRDARAQAMGRGEREAPDLGGLPVAGITRRRMLQLASCLAAAWLVFAFLRQVGDVTAASGRADALRAGNAQLSREVDALEAELRLIQRQDYVVQEARAYRLGSAREVPFTLAQPAPALPADAPGSAAGRIGAETETRPPLESWLTLLFGAAT